jgi:hypothetical protein
MIARAEANEAAIGKDPGDGLALRRARAEDVDALAEFNAMIHNDPSVGFHIRDLMSGRRPGFAPGDFTIVEQRETGEIVSSLCLAPLTWSYEGVVIPVGMPEFVGTLPAYRGRGLVRAQMEMIARWSEERGHLVQAILGIPWFYRQFGYEMALDAHGGREADVSAIRSSAKDKAGEDAERRFRLRPAGGSDLPFLGAAYERSMARYGISAVIDAEAWSYQLSGISAENANQSDFFLIESPDGRRAGFAAVARRLEGEALAVRLFEADAGISWRKAAPGVFRSLLEIGKARAQDGERFEKCRFELGSEHPLYLAYPRLLQKRIDPYAFYLRIPDLPRLIEAVAPALERRLAESPLVGHDGELKLCFYADGLRLVFGEGRLTRAEPWNPRGDEGADAAFPGLTFAQLLFGYRSPEDLQRAFPDCWIGGDEPYALLSVLFPVRPSFVWTLV